MLPRDLIALAYSNCLSLHLLIFACTAILLITLCGHRKLSSNQRRKHEQFAQEMRRMQRIHKLLDTKATKRRGKKTLDFLKRSSASKGKSRKHVSKRQAPSADKGKTSKADEQRLRGTSPRSESAPTSSRHSYINRPKSPSNMVTASGPNEQVRVMEDKKMQTSLVWSANEPPILNKESEQSLTGDEEVEEENGKHKENN